MGVGDGIGTLSQEAEQLSPGGDGQEFLPSSVGEGTLKGASFPLSLSPAQG